MVRLLHGTSATHRSSIELLGLVEPWEGRGVSATTARWYARLAAETACVYERAARRSDEDSADILLVAVDVDGLQGRGTGCLDLAPSVVVAEIPPERIIGLEVVTVVLPARGTWGERSLLRSGFASPGPGRRAERTMAFRGSSSVARMSEKLPRP